MTTGNGPWGSQGSVQRWWAAFTVAVGGPTTSFRQGLPLSFPVLWSSVRDGVPPTTDHYQERDVKERAPKFCTTIVTSFY